MEDREIKILLDASERLISKVSIDFRRYLVPRIDWTDDLICIKGPKGTGKTTLMLQHIRETFGEAPERAVYLALDHLWFASHDVLETVEWFVSHGYEYLFIDEVHHYKNWSRLIKTISDFYPQLKIVYSGSSILKLGVGTADLSRRQAVYLLKGMSFREFLAYEGVAEVPRLDFQTLLKEHRSLAREIVSRCKVLPRFSEYLRYGYYPFYRRVGSQFAERLAEAVGTVLSVDLPAVEDITPPTVRKARRMLMVLAASCPQQPNMSRLYAELETDRNLGLKLLGALERAELFTAVDSGLPSAAKLKHLSRPEKLFLGDTNLMHALTGDPDIGAVRETFFVNQLTAAGHKVSTPQKGDFIVDDRWLFEIGGAGKGFSQIKGIEESFVANDGVEVGIGNKIPLWLFGCLY